MTDIVERLNAAVDDRDSLSWRDIVEAAEEIERLRAMMAWQPITTAPKDGTAILVWRPKEVDGPGAHVGVDWWSGNSWYRSRTYQQPTRWMPLPEEPQL